MVQINASLDRAEPAVAARLRKEQSPKMVTYSHCARNILLIPISSYKSPQDITTAMLAGTNANTLVDIEVTTHNFFSLIYNSACADYTGYPVKL